MEGLLSFYLFESLKKNSEDQLATAISVPNFMVVCIQRTLLACYAAGLWQQIAPCQRQWLPLYLLLIIAPLS